MLNRCITDNKSKDVPEDHQNYCITYNYEYLEDYVEEAFHAYDAYDRFFDIDSLGSDSSDVDELG